MRIRQSNARRIANDQENVHEPERIPDEIQTAPPSRPWFADQNQTERENRHENISVPSRNSEARSQRALSRQEKKVKANKPRQMDRHERSKRDVIRPRMKDRHPENGGQRRDR